MNTSASSRIHTLNQLTTPLLEWCSSAARDLPWRVPAGNTDRPNPYHVWISEIMLQQTRVEAVRDYYTRFLSHLPDVKSLAEVPQDDLMKLWQGLGYYSRANNLKRAAIQIQAEYDGNFPRTYEEILTLPGIGEYTAGAIASIAFGEAVPAIDGNVYRIYTRLFEDSSDITKTPFKKQLRAGLLETIPPEAPGTYNQAWMDLGATVCLPNGAPKCSNCPWQSSLPKRNGALRKKPLSFWNIREPIWYRSVHPKVFLPVCGSFLPRRALSRPGSFPHFWSNGTPVQTASSFLGGENTFFPISSGA